MHKRRASRTLAAAAAILLTGAVAVRPVAAGPVANDNELLLSGGFFHAQDSDFSNVALDMSWGRYLGNPSWQLGILQALNWSIIDDAEDPWSATTAPFVHFHFLGISQRNVVVPFLGAFVGAVWNDDDATGTLGPDAGLKFFVTDDAFLQTKYRYEWFFNEFESADDESDEGNHVVSLGIGYVWGGTGSRE
jgi:hypothetical protein